MSRDNIYESSTLPNRYDDKINYFCRLIDRHMDSFILQDPDVLRFFRNNLDIIFYFLTFNYKCICKKNLAMENKKEPIKYNFEHKNNVKINLEVPVNDCKHFKFDIIDKLISLICCYNVEFRFYFTPCLKILSQNSDIFNRECEHFEKFISIFCRIFDNFLKKDRNDSFMNKNFVNLVIDNCDVYEIQSLLFVCITKNTFMVYFNQIDIVAIMNKVITVENSSAIKILNLLLIKENKKTEELIKNGWNVVRFEDSLCTYEAKYFELLYIIEDEIDFTRIYNFLCKILDLNGRHEAFLSTFENIIRDRNFDFSPKKIYLKYIYMVKLISKALEQCDYRFMCLLEYKKIFEQIFTVFFNNENCTLFHQAVFSLVKSLYSHNIDANFRPIILSINLLTEKLYMHAREYFARENEANGVVPSIFSYYLLIYIELQKLHKECKQKDNLKLEKINKALSKSFESENFFMIKWYLDRCVKKDLIELEEDAELDAFLEEGYGETHARYVYYKMLHTFPCNQLFDML